MNRPASGRPTGGGNFLISVLLNVELNAELNERQWMELRTRLEAMTSHRSASASFALPLPPLVVIIKMRCALASSWSSWQPQ